MRNLLRTIKSQRTSHPNCRFPPLSLGIVAALTPGDWVVEVIDENFDEFSFRDADLVGITAFTSAANRAYEIATVYRERNIPVVMGGIHASMCSEEAKQFVDAVVVGEVESVWGEVIADVLAGNLKPIYNGSWSGLEQLQNHAAIYIQINIYLHRCKLQGVARWIAIFAPFRHSMA